MKTKLIIVLFLFFGRFSYASEKPELYQRFCRVSLDYVDAFALKDAGDVLAKFIKKAPPALKIHAFLAAASAKAEAKQVREALRLACRSGDEVIKAYAELTLALLEGGLSRDILQPYTESSLSQVRAAAVRIIGRSGKKAFLDWLKELFGREKNALVKAEIIAAWGRNAYAAAGQEIRQGLASSSWLVRNAAVMALGNIDDRNAKDMLVKALRQEKNAVVRANTKVLLGQWGISAEADEEELKSSNAQLKGSSLLALANLGRREILPAAKRILLDGNAPETLRYYAAKALAVFKASLREGGGRHDGNAGLCEGGVAIEDILAQGLYSQNAAERRIALRLLIAYAPRLVYFIVGLEDRSYLVAAQVLASGMDRFVQENWTEPQALKDIVIAAINKKCLRK